MDALISAFVCVAGAGAAGGALNALATDNQCPWPLRMASVDRPPLFRPGLAVNVAIGGALSAATFWTFAGGLPATAVGRAVLQFVFGLLIGMLGARWITSEADKRLLRAAACKAAAAPAADPTTIREMELAPPAAVLRMATALEPRRTTPR
jgi:hypothetical protein